MKLDDVTHFPVFKNVTKKYIQVKVQAARKGLSLLRAAAPANVWKSYPTISGAAIVLNKHSTLSELLHCFGMWIWVAALIFVGGIGEPRCSINLFVQFF